MSDYWLSDTPDLTYYYCPGCEPEQDPFEHREDGKVWVVEMCGAHMDSRQGDADPADDGLYLSGTADSGGEDSRRMIAILHRERPADQELGDRPLRRS